MDFLLKIIINYGYILWLSIILGWYKIDSMHSKFWIILLPTIILVEIYKKYA